MKNTDTRVQYTKHILFQTIIELLKEKPISKITVKEICDRAGLNRGTFYLHYDSPEALLKDVETAFIAEHQKKLFSFWQEDRNISMMEIMVSFMEDNRETLAVLMSPNADPEFVAEILSQTKGQIVKEWMGEFPGYSKEKCEFVFDYVVAGSTKLISTWLNSEERLSVKEFTNRMERLGHYSLVAIQEF
ncbi:MAG: TetR/AcrR family transcriptional regulator [Oscillospiraceae bacterium]|nr:TetR/AcrR family transcriptional regulator [Oscillospiraceae bacterium]